MHKLIVLVLGPASFISTLNELKPFLKFNCFFETENTTHDAIFFHKDSIQDKATNDYINKSKSLKICASKDKNLKVIHDAFLELPTSVREINNVIENVSAKKIFSENASIIIKKYFLNKNEKKLTKGDNSIILTEKEIQLLQLFLNSNKPISKDLILTKVWNYSADADTHTDETHIYRLRKKISDKFMDDAFILNNKDGYYL